MSPSLCGDIPAGAMYSLTRTWFGRVVSFTMPDCVMARRSDAAKGGSGSVTNDDDGDPPKFATRRRPLGTHLCWVSGAWIPASTARSSSTEMKSGT